MTTTTSLRNARRLVTRLLLGITLASGLAGRATAASAVQAATRPERLPVAAPTLQADPTCAGGCHRGPDLARAWRARGAKDLRRHPDPDCTSVACHHIDNRGLMTPHLGATRMRMHPDPTCPSCGGPGDPVPWVHQRSATSPPAPPDLYHPTCGIRTCDPAVASASQTLRSLTLRIGITHVRRDVQPLLNPQPLPPHGDDTMHPH